MLISKCRQYRFNATVRAHLLNKEYLQENDLHSRIISTNQLSSQKYCFCWCSYRILILLQKIPCYLSITSYLHILCFNRAIVSPRPCWKKVQGISWQPKTDNKGDSSGSVIVQFMSSSDAIKALGWQLNNSVQTIERCCMYTYYSVLKSQSLLVGCMYTYYNVLKRLILLVGCMYTYYSVLKRLTLLVGNLMFNAVCD